MDAVLAFAAAIVALRLAAELGRRARARHAPDLGFWAASLAAFAVAAAALAAGAAAGWHDATFRVYYLFGGLLTAPLLGVGSLLRAGVRRALPAGLLYTGLAAGVAVSAPLTRSVSGDGIPAAADHLDAFPARVLAIAANSAGTLAVVAVALLTLRRRPLGNGLVLAGVAAAASGSAVSGLGEAGTAALLALATALLYAGATMPAPKPREQERDRDEQHDPGLGERAPRASVRDEAQPRERIHRPPTV